MSTYTFLSDGWIDATRRLESEHRGDSWVDDPSTSRLEREVREVTA